MHNNADRRLKSAVRKCDSRHAHHEKKPMLPFPENVATSTRKRRFGSRVLFVCDLLIPHHFLGRPSLRQNGRTSRNIMHNITSPT